MGNTTAGPIRKSANPKAFQERAFCYNCSKKGHFGHECSQRRMYNWSYPSLPIITYYDTVNDIKCREFRLKKKAREMQDAGLISPDGGVVTFTPQPPRKKQKISYSPHPYPNNTNNQHTPKKRIAHTPKHNPQTNQQNTDWKVKQNSKKPGPHGKNTPQSKEFKSQKKEAKKKKKKRSAFIDEDADFPRGSKKSPHKAGFYSSPQKANVKPVKLFGVENHMKKKDKSKKKERIQRKRQQKAAKDSAAYPTDENLFQIKQRKVKRSK
ncbi:zinc finger CCHC domain-containing protein 7 [Danio aesculapii]|uniref:zinc finger CCHC domain-containing protein 7 n=1 Tax=Danio aesculapii TaxID=1142201 RepID=UPI0024C03B9E|nr:zinc finger CCHC domain-containing protein 7 [Danio aesculapii]